MYNLDYYQDFSKNFTDEIVRFEKLLRNSILNFF